MTKKENVQKESSSDEEEEESSTEHQNIILGFDEHPDIIIEKILIKIYNNIIKNKNKNDKYIISFQKKVNDLCSKHKPQYIILYLLINIRNIIEKYRKRIYEMSNIIELKKNNLQKYYFRSTSINEKYSKKYINFGINRFPKNYGAYSPNKIMYLDYYMVIKTLFNKLKDIKNCLKKAAPIIEKIFELPLSYFDKFSILDCENEDFLNILIHDNLIWHQILQNRGTVLNHIIQELLEDKKKNLNTMSEKIEIFRKMVANSKIGCSLDERFPEDAKMVTEVRYRLKGSYDDIYNLLNDDENNIYFHAREEEEEGEEIDIDIEEQNIKEVKENNLSNINMIRFNGKNINNISIISNIDNIEEKSTEKNVITNNVIKEISNININEANNLNNITNVSKVINKETLEKNFKNNKHNLNINNTIRNLNINNITHDKSNKINILNKGKLFKKPGQILFKKKQNNINKNKKENNTNNNNKFVNTNKNIKNDKKEIPSDIDDLVKYIENDEKNETKNKKKKKNKKKTKKKNKGENDIKEQNIEEDDKDKQENDEINEIKDNFVKNSINRFKIHKIKFKYKKEWLENISKKY